MHWLNYHHLLYFYVVAREGGIVPASKVLHLAHPTISGQLRKLETALGERLFERSGRRLLLTATGRLVYRYAEEIFGIGQELVEALRGLPLGRPLQLRVGITQVMPKLIVKRLLQPAFDYPEPLRIYCEEDNQQQLLTALAAHQIDLVLTDMPLPHGVRVKAYEHILGGSPVALYAAPQLAERLVGDFPRSLEGAPLLLPTPGTSLRRSLDRWFERRALRPQIVGEFADSALLKVFGRDGIGAFASPQVIADAVMAQHGVREVGVFSGISERYYAISVERRIKHPAVVAICERARDDLFHSD
jgi:LysR family transcriptional activator of nhaA